MNSFADGAPRLPAHASVKVLILEGQEVIRRGLLDIVSSIPGTTASSVSFDSARDAEMLRKFDVALVSTLTLINAERAGLALGNLNRIVVIVPASAPDQLEIATRRHADGYIMQDELTPSTLRRAIFGAVDGQLIVPDAIASYLLSRARGQHPASLSHHLRPREAEVLELLVAGASNKEIARKLRISIHGVKRHVSALLTQFHSPNRVHLVSHILQSGMISLSGAAADQPYNHRDGRGRSCAAPAAGARSRPPSSTPSVKQGEEVLPRQIIYRR